jgi:hypothetical protein
LKEIDLNRKQIRQPTDTYDVAFSRRVYLYVDVEVDTDEGPANVLENILKMALFYYHNGLGDHNDAKAYTLTCQESPIGEVSVQIQFADRSILVFFSDEEVGTEREFIMVGRGGLVPVPVTPTLNMTRNQETLH